MLNGARLTFHEVFLVAFDLFLFLSGLGAGIGWRHKDGDDKYLHSFLLFFYFTCLI